MTHIANEFIAALEAHKNTRSAESHAQFFKAFPGGYGEDDRFWGLRVPLQRSIGKQFYKQLSLEDMAYLIKHPVHEVRLSTLMMLVLRFEKSIDEIEKEAIVKLYLGNLVYVNNWDLVDSSAHYILGAWLRDKDHSLLFELAESEHLWTQRVAMISSFHFIKNNRFDTALKLAVMLLHHKHDLIHKAVGWMLREIGNRDYDTEYRFLIKHYSTMPRTMLRYAIEKFDEPVRQDFLKGRL